MTEPTTEITELSPKRKRGGPFKSLAGKKFGMLAAIRRSMLPLKKPVMYECLCDCGNRKDIASSQLSSGVTTDCGCQKRTSKCKTTHGKAYNRIYSIWNGMKMRCDNPNHHAYARYGGRGIKHCVGWNDFENFHRDMGDGIRGLSLERIDNDSGYFCGNCPDCVENKRVKNLRWATSLEQGANQATNRNLTIDGKTLSVSNWAREVGIRKVTIFARLNMGWSDQDAVMKPIQVIWKKNQPTPPTAP